MKNLKTLLILLPFLGTLNQLQAQQLQTPMEFIIDAPNNIAKPYDYGYAINWGPTTIPKDIVGELGWGITALGDSTGCSPITTNLTNKIAVVRRGGCNFSLKSYHAQQAGAKGTIIINNNAGNQIVNMTGGDSMTAITTPTVFLTLEDGNTITSELANGNQVDARFSVIVFKNESLYHFATPQSQIKDLDNISLTIYNRNNFFETNITVLAKITNPNGIVTILTENIPQLSPNSDTTITFSTAYTPTIIGDYSIEFMADTDSSTYDNKSHIQKFIITPYTWANDNAKNLSSLWPLNFPNDLRYDVGNIYYASDTGEVTHVSFGFYQTSNVHGETFNIALYDLDINLDGLIDGSDYHHFTQLATASYTVDSLNTPLRDTILVELSPSTGTSINLNSGGIYLAVVQYDAIANGNGNTTAPRYLFSQPINYNKLSTIIYTGQLFLGGFFGNNNATVRLHLKGYKTATNTTQVNLQDNISIQPNPATNQLTIKTNKLNLQSIQLLSLSGQVVQETHNLNRHIHQLQVNHHNNGLYFLRIQTDKGVVTKKVMILK